MATDMQEQAALAQAIRALSRDETTRLARAGGRLARGLAGGITAAELLNEAVLRGLAGSRRRPPEVPLAAFLAGVMRSIAEEHRRVAQRRAEHLVSLDDGPELPIEAGTGGIDPERSYAGVEALAALRRVVAGDDTATAIIDALCEGWSAPEIRARLGLGDVEYESARKRLRRALTRRTPA